MAFEYRAVPGPSPMAGPAAAYYPPMMPVAPADMPVAYAPDAGWLAPAPATVGVASWSAPAWVASLQQQLAWLRSEIARLLAPSVTPYPAPMPLPAPVPAPLAPPPAPAPPPPPLAPPPPPPAPPAPPVQVAPAPRPKHPPKPKKPKPRPNPLDGSGPALHQGAVGAPVKRLQARLTQLGFHPGPSDGEFGARTAAAVRQFQRHEHLKVDGQVGPQTWKHLDVHVTGKVRYPETRGGNVRKRLLAHLHNGYSQAVHQCFSYAWATVTLSGGRSIGNARQSHEGRWKSISYLSQMAQDGRLHVGDVVYANRHPGADPSSTNLAYGPHWFVYLGNGQYADQYGVKGSASQMQAFVPGRVLDTIYRTF